MNCQTLAKASAPFRKELSLLNIIVQYKKIKSQAKMKNKKFRKSAIKIALIIIGAIIISYFVFTWKQIAL